MRLSKYYELLLISLLFLALSQDASTEEVECGNQVDTNSVLDTMTDQQEFADHEKIQSEIQVLINQLGDSDYQTREDAHQELLSLGARHIDMVTEALPLNHNDPETSNRCEEIRRRLPLEKLIYQSLLTLEDDQALKDAVRHMLTKPNTASIQNVIDHAGQQKPQVGEILWSLTESRVPEVRIFAINGFGKLGDASFSLKITGLLKDEHKRVSYAATKALKQLNDRTIIPSVAELLEDENTDIRVTALKTLSVLKAKSEKEKVTALLKDQDGTIRRETIYALITLGDDSSVDEIIQLLDENDTGVRRAALKAVMTMGRKSHISQIANLLDDPHMWIQRMAAIGIFKITGQPIKKDGVIEDARKWWNEHKDDPEFHEKSE